MKVLKIVGIVVVTLALLVFVGMKVSGISPIALDLHPPVQTNDGVAINGYDPVAYHTVGKATVGKDAISYSYKGIKWNFASEEHKNLFEANPDKYVPVAGGHCLFAASTGFVAPSNPEFWSLKEGKLMLYSDQAVKEKCEQNLKEVLMSSLKNWK